MWWLGVATDIDLEWPEALQVPRGKGQVISESYTQVEYDGSIFSRNDNSVHIHFHVVLSIIYVQHHG